MSKKLRVSHFPQVPCEPFIAEVKDLYEAKKIMDTLAYYDLFQYKNRIKPDYTNVTVLEEWDVSGLVGLMMKLVLTILTNI